MDLPTMPKKLLRKKTTPRSLPRPLEPVAIKAKRRKPGRPPREALTDTIPGTTIARGTHAELIESAFAFAPEGEGVLITIISTPRAGKTDLARKIVRARMNTDIVLIHDPKIPANYPWAESGIPAFPHGIARAKTSAIRFGSEFIPYEIVELGLELARGGSPTTTVVDENQRATKGPQVFDGEALRRAYTEGSSQGHSLIALTQIPQWCPTVQIDFSQAIIVGRNGGRTLAYLEKQLLLTPDCVSAIRTLGVGEWVLISRFEEWDRTVYYSPHEQ